jgi:hypothetical protein
MRSKETRSARVPFSLLIYDNHNQQFVVTANLCQTFGARYFFFNFFLVLAAHLCDNLTQQFVVTATLCRTFGLV